MSQRYDRIYIDLPDPDRIGSEDESWKNVHTLWDTTREEAVAWIRENVGPCDDDGKIDPITLGTPIR